MRGLIERASSRVPPLRYLRATLRVFHERQCMPRSAEIAYYSILSTLPFGALVLSVFAYAAVDVLGTDWTAEDALRLLAQVAPSLVPASKEQFDSVFRHLLEGRETLGFVGSVAMLVTSSLALGAVDRSLAAIFCEPKRGRLSSTFLFAILLLAVVVLFVLGVSLLVAVSTVIQAEGYLALELVLKLATAGSLGLFYLFLLRVVARAQVRLQHALVGAALFVGLFELSRAGYIMYLGSVSQFSVVYGSLAGTMAAIVWAYVVALVLLFSTCVVRVLHEGLADEAFAESPREESAAPDRRGGE